MWQWNRSLTVAAPMAPHRHPALCGMTASMAASTCGTLIVVMHSDGRVPRGQASIMPQGEHQRPDRTT
jgi:hypothetical protein